ncbi:Predicted NTPase (NACHT family) [Aeromonas hydrophila]|nr:Predicted NTPase (NACHT family) [Aeromonas hydrophila]
MDGIELKMAKDILKPASGFIDALLSAKIEKVKSWAHKKELLNDMKEDKLQVILEKYISRILSRASELSTIVFPQKKIPLETVYEPLHLGSVGNEWSFNIENNDYHIDLKQYGKCYLIVDRAGMGKSTYSKNLALSLLKNSEFIPILFDLSEYDSQLSLIDNIIISFDEIDSRFSRELFKKLIVDGYFFIIFDGFDEAPTEHQDHLRKQLREFNDKKGLASLLVTSRPHERLPDFINSEMFSLKSLTKEQAISLINKYDSISGANIGKSLSKEIDKVPDKFLETPLLVGLLYRTYGFNNSIAQKISVFYSELFDALYKGHDLTKAGFVRKKESGLDIDAFRQLLRAFSFLFILKSSEGRHSLDYLNELANDAQKLCSFEPISSRNFLSDLLLAVPLIYRDGNSYKFMHKSIAEYFASEYICNTANKKEMLEAIISSPARNDFKEAIEYIHELSPGLYQEVISLPIAKNFLELHSRKNTSELFATMQYTQDFVVSYWKYDDVVELDKDSRVNINTPKPEGMCDFNSTSYMYGNFNGVKYVVCCSSNKKPPVIPDGAWLDLTTCLIGDTQKISYMRINSNGNIKALVENLKEGVYYNAESLFDFNKSSFILEILARQNTRFSRKINDDGDSTRVLSFSQCNKLIEKVDSLHRAEVELSALMKIPNN